MPRSPEDNHYQPYELAKKTADQIDVSVWRRQCRGDTATVRWADLFDKIEPSEAAISITTMLLRATNGTLSASYCYAIALAAWTYGYADACNNLADEEITLWDGKAPLDFPYDNVKERE